MKTIQNKETSIETYDVMPSVGQLVQAKIDELEAQGLDDAFFLGDLGDVVSKFVKWKELLPRVQPFYAIKCNPDDKVVKLLADLGTGFDCASKGEIAQVLAAGVPSSRIIYANPCKQKSFLKYACKHSVDLMTFDNEAELYKVKELYPNARLVLRLLPTTDFKVQCELGNKFGCHPDSVATLLARAQELDLNVMGISFHVGSGVEEAAAFSCAVRQAHKAWKLAEAMGFSMSVLDIGGGFPGQASAPVSFSEIATVLNVALDQYFPPTPGVDIIAEPGRYFVASAFTLSVNIIAKRTVARDVADHMGPPDGHHQQLVSGDDEPSHMYYVNDGVYGSFNSLMYDHATVEAKVPQAEEAAGPGFSSSVWGPTCDGLDCILTEVRLPELQVGEWMYFEDMGAYTMCAGSCFNGMPRADVHWYCHQNIWDAVERLRRGEPVDAAAFGEVAAPQGASKLIMKSGTELAALSAACNHARSPIEEEMVA